MLFLIKIWDYFGTKEVQNWSNSKIFIETIEKGKRLIKQGTLCILLKFQELQKFNFKIPLLPTSLRWSFDEWIVWNIIYENLFNITRTAALYDWRDRHAQTHSCQGICEPRTRSDHCRLPDSYGPSGFKSWMGKKFFAGMANSIWRQIPFEIFGAAFALGAAL